MSDQEIAADITKAVCTSMLDKSPPANAGEIAQAAATIYRVVFEAVRASEDK
jgi:hypothetical protein